MINTILQIIKKNIKLILISNVIILILGIIVSLLLPEKFKADASFVRADEELFGMSSMSAQISMGLLGMENNQYETANIVRTRWLLDRLIEEENLIEYYHLKNSADAYGLIINNITVEDKRDGMTVIGYIDRDPQKAASICNTIVKYIDLFRQRMEKSTLADYGKFLEETKVKIEHEIESVKDSVIFLTTKYGVWIDENNSFTPMNSMLTSIRDSIINKEIKYQYYKTQNANSPFTKNTKKELDFLYDQWTTIYTKGYKTPKDQLILPAFKKSPEIILSFYSLNAELELKTSLYEILMQEYYNNMFTMNKQVPKIKIIDRAIPPVKREFPKRKLLILGLLMIIFVLDALFIQFKMKNDAQPK